MATGYVPPQPGLELVDSSGSGNVTSSGGDVLAKGLSILVLILLTMGFGMLALVVLKAGSPSKYRNLRKKIISYLNSFAGGVFLGACLLHLMVEGQEEMEEYLTTVGLDWDYPVYMLLVASGVVAVMVVEQFALMCTPEQHQHSHSQQHNQQHQQQRPASQQHTDYGACANGGFQLDNSSELSNIHNDAVPDVTTKGGGGVPGAEVCGHHDLEQSLSHTHGVETRDNVGGLRSFLLLAALSFHTIFDGLAVGLQRSTVEVWQMLVAVSVHKSLVAFCLSLSLFKSLWDSRPKFCVAALTFFALMSPLGIVVGIAVTESNVDATSRTLVSAILQGLATGTFLYVTFLEILREEFGHCKRSFLKVFVVILGFGAMAAVKLLDRD